MVELPKDSAPVFFSYTFNGVGQFAILYSGVLGNSHFIKLEEEGRVKDVLDSATSVARHGKKLGKVEGIQLKKNSTIGYITDF